MAKRSTNPKSAIQNHKSEQPDPSLPFTSAPSGPVECLGMTFPNDDERRKYYLENLAEKLKDPAFRRIEGFPIGEDEDILALSDPPYYTACPNPWLAEFANKYGASYNPKNDKYHREPFAADVSEGKTDAIYKAHGYHTKTPHKAIMRFILHYTDPGDIVFDGFSGTGLAGVAAQLCANREEVSELGYRVGSDDQIIDSSGKTVSRLGPRRSILNDLSPAASFIAYNYNTPFCTTRFQETSTRILDDFYNRFGWMYETISPGGRDKASINFTVWSEVFSCPECGGEVNFLREALTKDEHVLEEFPCPHCDASLTKKRLQKVHDTVFDKGLRRPVIQDKRIPVRINFEHKGSTGEREISDTDQAVLRQIAELDFPSTFPTDRMMHMSEDVEAWGDKWRSGTASFTHVHHAFLPRAIHALAALWQAASRVEDFRIRQMVYFTFEQAIWGLSLMNRYGPTHYSQVNRYLSGVYYIASQISECSPRYILLGKISRLCSAFGRLGLERGASIISTCDASALSLPESSVDYIFVDPPFGDNLAYAELNFIVEAFHRIFTNTRPEAIISHVQQKSLSEYHQLMTRSFKEYFRVLKPGRWMTIEFSNTQSSVWNAIQTGLQEAGFVVANVAALDKQQRGFNAVVTPTSVKQDLVISAYKPNGGLELRFSHEADSEEGAWDFVRTHLRNLPVVKPKGGQLEPIAERDPRILYDRTVAFYIRHGIPVPISSPEFRAGLAEKFPERDGMYFLPDQAAEYDKARMRMEGIGQLMIFVEDERSAADWLRNYLKYKPSKYQDIQPEFFEQLNQSWKKWETRPELRALLDQYFLCYQGEGDVPPQIHSYFSTNFKDLRNLPADHAILRAKARDRWYVPDPRKDADVEKLRERRLLEEFWSYVPPGYEPASRRKTPETAVLPGLEPKPRISKGKRLTIVRTEAVRVGFMFCFQQNDYQTIIAVAQHIPEDVIHNDEQLQMIYDSAVTRTGDEE